MLRIMANPSAFLIAIDRFHGGIDVDGNVALLNPASFPDLLSQPAHDSQKRPGLIDPQAVQITPIGTGCRKFIHSEDAAKHGLQANVNKMPDPFESDKHEHHKPHDHGVVAQLGFPETAHESFH